MLYEPAYLLPKTFRKNILSLPYSVRRVRKSNYFKDKRFFRTITFIYLGGVFFFKSSVVMQKKRENIGKTPLT